MSEVQFPLEFETFRLIDKYQQRALTRDQPDVFNGVVEVKRYRVTVEEIQEPDEVICARLQRLWDENKNCHNFRDLARIAEEYDYQFKVKV
jgi:hypothetical protein